MKKFVTVAVLVVALSSLCTTTSVGAQGTATASRRIYRASEVDKVVQPLSTNPAPSYPHVLRLAEMDGEVHAQFIVDSAGHVDSLSVKIISTTHPLFALAVRAVLPAQHFTPAEKNGKRVAELVEMPFYFKH